MVRMGGMRALAAWAPARGALRAAAAGALMLLLGGCAPSLEHAHADLRTLTQAQMAPNHFHSPYEAVQALRGNWLNPPTNTVFSRYGSAVSVYLDNIRLGGPSELQGIPLNAVVYIRYFDALEATTRWGLDHSEGVIYVSTHPLGSAAAPPGS